LAARKNTLSIFCAGQALSTGYSVPTVLPMPVGACAIRQRPCAAARYAASASARWPGRNPACGKARASQALIARGAVRHFLARPGQEARALVVEERAQGGAVQVLLEQGLLRGADVEVDEGDGQPVQPAGFAQQRAVDLGLGPVQRAVVGGLAGQVAAVGLDLLEPVVAGVEAVGATAHDQVLVPAFERQFAFVAGATPRGHRRVAGDAFLGRGGGGEPQVEVAGLCGEFAKGADGHGVRHARALAGDRQRRRCASMRSKTARTSSAVIDSIIAMSRCRRRHRSRA
jgi:hypothetical protein